MNVWIVELKYIMNKLGLRYITTEYINLFINTVLWSVYSHCLVVDTILFSSIVVDTLTFRQIIRRYKINKRCLNTLRKRLLDNVFTKKLLLKFRKKM